MIDEDDNEDEDYCFRCGGYSTNGPDEMCDECIEDMLSEVEEEEQ